MAFILLLEIPRIAWGAGIQLTGIRGWRAYSKEAGTKAQVTTAIPVPFSSSGVGVASFGTTLFPIT